MAMKYIRLMSGLCPRLPTRARDMSEAKGKGEQKVCARVRSGLGVCANGLR